MILFPVFCILIDIEIGERRRSKLQKKTAHSVNLNTQRIATKKKIRALGTLFFNRFGKLISYCHSLSVLDYFRSGSVSFVSIRVVVVCCHHRRRRRHHQPLEIIRHTQFARFLDKYIVLRLSNKTVKCQIDSIIIEWLLVLLLRLWFQIEMFRVYLFRGPVIALSEHCKSIGTKLIICFYILTFLPFLSCFAAARALTPPTLNVSADARSPTGSNYVTQSFPFV